MNSLLAVLATAGVIASSGCGVSFTGGRTVVGSGNVVSETREPSGFDRIAVGGSGRLTIIQGDEESLQITADDNLLPLIESEVIDGALRIGAKNVSLRPSRPVEYVVRLKDLRELSLSGSLSAEAEELAVEGLDAEISGSGSIRIPHLQTGDLGVRISGSGSATLAGSAESADLSVSGSGDFNAGDLKTGRAEVHISGSGNAVVWAVDSLRIRVSGSGDVRYYGSPSVDSSVSGSGKARGLGAKE